ncbi:MAG: peptidylprolyl isomerase [Pyrinomonadaceae bacterium]
MSKKVGIWVLVVAAVFGSIAVWQVQESRAKAAKIEAEILRTLTEDDVITLLKNQQLVEPSKTYSVVQSVESRKVFLGGLREYLALAARARREGVADDQNIKQVLEYKSDVLLFSLYQNKLDNDIGKLFEVPKDQIEAFMADPANVAKYEADMNAIKAIQRDVARSTGNPLTAPSAGDGEAKEKTRENWVKAKIISSMAKADSDFMSQRAIQLRLKVAEAGVLATNYLNKYWADNIRVNDKEISDYLASHPEYDIKIKQDTAQKVFERVKAGEDFAALAKQFSEDRMTKSKGGLYEDVRPGFLWAEVEQTVMALENGHLANKVIETKDGFHIVQLVSKRSETGEAGKTVPVFNVRHILLQKRFEEPGIKLPNVPPPFLTPREIAEAAMRKQKRQAFVDRIVEAEDISLPEDFAFEVTEELKNSGLRLENALDKTKEEKNAAAKK